VERIQQVSVCVCVGGGYGAWTWGNGFLHCEHWQAVLPAAHLAAHPSQLAGVMGFEGGGKARGGHLEMHRRHITQSVHRAEAIRGVGWGRGGG
jgi:hypothetical protein